MLQRRRGGGRGEGRGGRELFKLPPIVSKDEIHTHVHIHAQRTEELALIHSHNLHTM